MNETDRHETIMPLWQENTMSTIKEVNQLKHTDAAKVDEEKPKPKPPMSAQLDQVLEQPTDVANCVVTNERYRATPEETAARDAVRSRSRKKTPRIQVTVTESNGKGPMVSWSLDHQHQGCGHYLLMDAFGLGAESDFYIPIVTDLLKAATQGRTVDQSAVNFMVSVIKSIEPKNELEVLLGTQIAMTHRLSVDFARRLNSADDIPQRDSLQNSFNKLCRTFISQLEALKRYRSTGQRVVVEHLHVTAGGQAVVAGTITHGGVGSPEKPE